jgi:RNA-directed DNA polymerase
MQPASEIEPTELGTPQGGPLSPLLANIYLHQMDTRLTTAGFGLVRYADDFVIFAKSEGAARAALELAEQVLTQELGLSLHPEKTRVVSVDSGFEFLGFHYYWDAKTSVRCKEVRRKSVQRFRAAVRSRTQRLHAQRLVKARHVTLRRLQKNDRVAGIVEALNQYIGGWHAYFKFARPRYGDYFEQFDSFIRRRLRAAIVGRTGHGWWDKRMPNHLLAKLGLKSIREMQTEYRVTTILASARKG